MPKRKAELIVKSDLGPLLTQLGDIYEDLDPRSNRCNIDGSDPRGMWRRQLQITGFELYRTEDQSPDDPDHCIVLVRDVDTGLNTRIRYDRFTRGGCRGYQKIGHAPVPKTTKQSVTVRARA